MRRVIVESPYAGDIERNMRYLRACLADCLRRGEAPFASHAIYTQPGVLDDNDPAQRKLGIEAGFAWRVLADSTIIYSDLGISRGMIAGIKDAERLQIDGDDHKIEYRELGGEWNEEPQSTPKCRHAAVVGFGPCPCDASCICRKRPVFSCDDPNGSVP